MPIAASWLWNTSANRGIDVIFVVYMKLVVKPFG